MRKTSNFLKEYEAKQIVNKCIPLDDNSSRNVRRTIERKQKEQLAWLNGLDSDKLHIIAGVISAKINQINQLTDEILFDCFGLSIEVTEKMERCEIINILKRAMNWMEEYKELLDQEGMDWMKAIDTKEKEILEMCKNLIVEKDKNQADSVKILRNEFPNIPTAEIVKCYRKVKDDFMKPTISADEIDKKRDGDKAKRANSLKKSNKNKREQENMSNETKNVETVKQIRGLKLTSKKIVADLESDATGLKYHVEDGKITVTDGTGNFEFKSAADIEAYKTQRMSELQTQLNEFEDCLRYL